LKTYLVIVFHRGVEHEGPFATFNEDKAEKMVMRMLNMYRDPNEDDVYQYVVEGEKVEGGRVGPSD